MSSADQSATPAKKGHTWIRLVVDYGGMATFFVAYVTRLRLVATHAGLGWTIAAGGHAPADITAATFWLMVGSAVALLIGLVVERRLAPMPLIAGGFALVFGGLTLFFHDPRIIKIKFTVVNTIFGATLLGGLALRKNLLKKLLGEALDMPEDAWRQLSLRYALYFLGMAALNEAIWRTQPDRIWVLFRGPGELVLVVVFSLTQIPFMMRYLKTSEPPPPPTD
ncbi:MAG: septation protein IspZ [Caulobacteraceae bacterium]|nr:septation protein IspZ [Caulobacteraceae bacterium]